MSKNLRKMAIFALAVVTFTSSNATGLIGNTIKANATTLESRETQTDYLATILSVDGKKSSKFTGTTLENNFSVKEILTMFGINTESVKSITDVNVTASDKEKIMVSDKSDFNLDTTFKLTDESRSKNNNGTQIRIRYTLDGKKVNSIKFNIRVTEFEKEVVVENSQYSIEYRDINTKEIISTTIYVPNEYVQTDKGEIVVPLKVGTVIKENNITGFFYNIEGYERVETSLKDGKQITIEKDSTKNVIIVYYKAINN